MMKQLSLWLGRTALVAALVGASGLAQALEPIPVKPPSASGGNAKGSRGPKVGNQARAHATKLDGKATERSLKSSIANQEQILELEDKRSTGYPRQAMALADFYWDLATFYGNHVNSEEIEKPLYEAEQRGDQKAVEKWQREQARYRDNERQYQNETITRYRKIVKDFPRADNIDEIRYFLAYNLTSMGRGEEGIEEYTKIITDHPKSPFVPDALVNIGDYYFERNDFQSAYRLYEKAETYPTSNLYGYSIYKQAWCLYNLQDYAKSLQRFIDVITVANESLAAGKQGGIALRREAQNELVLPYSKVGKPADAVRFLIKDADAQDRYLELAGRLAEIYTEQGEFKKSSELLRLLINEARTNAVAGQDKSYMVIQFQRQIVNNAIEPGDKKGTVEEIANLIRLYETEMVRAPKEFQETERGQIQRMMLEVAHNYHTEYNKTKEKKTLEYTQQLYDEYLRIFRNDENADQISLNNGLLMVSTGKYEAAAAEFEKLIEMAPDGKFSDLAAEQAVLAYLKVLDARGAATKIKNQAEEDLKPQEIPPEDRRFVGAIDRWMSLVARNGENPETKDNIPGARFAAAKVFYDYNHFDEAGKRFAGFVKQFPDHKFAHDAQRYLLSSYDLAGDVDNLRIAATELDKLPNLPEDLRGDIQKIKNARDFLECQKTLKAEKYLDAARCFEKYASEFPNEDRSVDAIYNAANAYFLAKKVVKALETQREILDKYPKHELAPKAAYAIGDMYRQTAAYAEAATWYEFLVGRYPDHNLAKNALRYAAVFRKTLGQYRQAVKNLQTYLAKYPSEGEAPRVDFDIALIYEKEEAWGKVLNALNAHLKKYKNEPPSVRLQVLNKRGLAFQRERKQRDALAAFQATLDTFRSLEDRFKQDLDMPAISAVAESHFNLGEVSLQQARAIKLDGRTDAAVKKAVDDKLAIMAKVKQTYEEVIAYGHPGWVVAASTQLGVAYRDLADAIEQSPVPANMRNFPEAEDAFRQAMAERSTQIREMALVNYRRALDTARDKRWFNDYSERAERAIAELDLEDKSVKEFRLRPTQLSPNAGEPSFLGGK